MSRLARRDLERFTGWIAGVAIADHGGPILPQCGARHRWLHGWAVSPFDAPACSRGAVDRSADSGVVEGKRPWVTGLVRQSRNPAFRRSPTSVEGRLCVVGWLGCRPRGRVRAGALTLRHRSAWWRFGGGLSGTGPSRPARVVVAGRGRRRGVPV